MVWTGDFERGRRPRGATGAGPAAQSRAVRAYAGVCGHHLSRGAGEVGAQPDTGGGRAAVQLDGQPYRGCSHGCVYCFARRTHTYLDLDAGDDFDRQIIVKINIGDMLARELRRASWTHEPVALGTNTDPYQRAEGRYRLMPGIIAALAGSGTPFSI